MAKSKAAATPQAVSKTIALHELRAGDSVNARRTARDSALDELKASILAHGVVQSLRVRIVDDAFYEVVAGNRRLMALQALQADGKIDGDYAVPVIVDMIDDARAHELSIVENVERVPVSPVDEVRAYGRLFEDGLDAKGIALRFGVPTTRVQQRLKLAALHPQVLDALDAGEINFDTAQAFTVAEPGRQIEVFKALKASRSLYAYSVRREITDSYLRSDSGLAKLIGKGAYLAAGGEVVADLFESHAYWTSREIITQLVEAKWADQIGVWLAEGWGWAKPAGDVPDLWERDRLYPEHVPPTAEDAARLEAIERALDELGDDGAMKDDPRVAALVAEQDEIQARNQPVYPAEKRGDYGVVYFPEDGRAMFGIGEPRKAAKAPTAKAALPPEDPAAVGPTISEYLSIALSDSIRTEVAADPDLALPLLAACFAVGQGGGTLPAHLSVGHATDASRDGKQELLEAFRYFDEMPDEELLASIARMFANTLDVRDGFLDQKLKYSSSPEAGRRALVAQLVDVVEPRSFPEFDAAVYFDGVKKPLIAAAFREITGETIKDGKKADMAATTAKLAVEHGWLPIALRNVSYGGPGSDAALVQEAAE